MLKQYRPIKIERIINPNINETMLKQDKFSIKDFAKIIMKSSEAIRRWERIGVIDKPPKNDRNRREYTPEMLANCLEQLINYPWKHKTITNMSEIRYVIDRLRKHKVVKPKTEEK